MTALIDPPHRPTPAEIADLFTPVEARERFEWPLPQLAAGHVCKRAAVAAVLARFEPAMVVTSELLDALIAAADTGI